MPKFSVGEQVILMSKDEPQHNGLQYVESVNPSLSFCLDGSLSHVGYRLLGLEDEWDETCLRKLPPKSDYSFDELMTNLKVVDKEFLEA